MRRAMLADLELIAPLFDAYRQFYQQTPDLALAREFLRERLEHDQSVIFLALRPDGTAAGFTQLFPSFSSASAQRIFILNDLFVDPAARRSGVGQLLLRAAAEFGRSTGAVRLTLSTAHTNTPAQSLYEAQGWRRDEVFRSYHLPLS
ncbi:MAG TPA: GNAT family N-acetyltransferase [Bryobacteraceae bacterium]|nr:GNAT family N-acetyltransferase [Bryobacteraceae bacterium]